MFALDLGLLLRSALVVVFACAAVTLSWRASANWRRTLLVWGFVGALLAPALTLALARTPAPRVVAVATSWARPRVDPGVEIASSPRWARMNAWAPRETSGGGFRGFGWLLWLGGAGLILSRLALGHLGVWRLTRRATLAEPLAVIERAKRVTSTNATIAFSADVKGPIATGIFRPHVLLPNDARNWSDLRLYTVLLHELTHVRQRDPLAQLLAEIVCAAQWWNPFAWWAKRRLERERELAADERVIASGMLPSDYASELLAIASELDAVTLPRVGVPVVGRSKLAHRIERILARDRARLPRVWQRIALPSAVLVVTTFVACASTSTSSPSTRAGARSTTPSAESSIQPAIQRTVDAELDRAKTEWSARGVSIVVLEPQTGKLLAVGNPALARESHVPGSTFKPLVVAAALETGAIQPDDRFDCGQGERLYSNGVRLRDAHPAGELSVSEILGQSSNVGLSKIFDKLGGPALNTWFARFHLSEPALDAAPGSLGPLDETSAGTMKGATIAIGFGAKISPFHIAAMYGAFANRGLYVPPSLDRNASGRSERVLQPETATRVVGMLESAVESGTAQAARIDGVRVAGKTGTADLDDAGSDAHSIAYFAGIVPADAPRFVIVVMVEDPKEGASGGRAAAPVFARIATQIL